MIKYKELKKMKWPLPPFPIGSEVKKRKIDSKKNFLTHDGDGEEVIGIKTRRYARIPYPHDYLESCYVKEGKISIIPLGDNSAVGSIPPGECGITALVKDKKGRIFGATSGGRVHLFAYSPKDSNLQDTYAVDLGIVEGNSRASGLVLDSRGRLFLSTEPESGSGSIYYYNPHDAAPGIEKVISPVRGEGICAMVINSDSDIIYGLTNKKGRFFVFNPVSGRVKLKGDVDKDFLFSKVLAITPDGDVIGGVRWGRFFQYKVREDRIVTLDIKAPFIRGREMYNGIDSLIADKSARVIYGGTTADGILFKLLPRQGKVISLGKPLNQPRIRCLAIGKDGLVYGIAGESCCHLFRYNPKNGEIIDLGIPFATIPRHWHGYEFDSAVSGDRGEIYFGQNESVSYLFRYTCAGFTSSSDGKSSKKN